MKNEEPTVKKGASYNTGGGAIIPTSSNNSNANSTSSNSGACEVIAASSVMRPRWCPTTEQIKILEAVFESGTTTPSRDMIVEIAECLKQFGHIVEANVFYWFQNRKARAKRRRLKLQPSYASATIIDGEVTDALLTSTLFNSSSPPPLVDALGHQDQYKYQYLHAQLAHQTFHQPRPTSNLPNMNFNPNPNPLVSNEHVHTPQTHTNKAIKLVPKGVPNNAQVQTPHINKSLMFDPQHVHKYTPLDPYIANNIKVNENYYPDPPMSTSLNMPLKRTWMEALDQAVDFVFPSVQNPDPQHHDMAHDEFHTSSTPNSSLPSKITLQGKFLIKLSSNNQVCCLLLQIDND